MQNNIQLSQVTSHKCVHMKTLWEILPPVIPFPSQSLEPKKFDDIKIDNVIPRFKPCILKVNPNQQCRNDLIIYEQLHQSLLQFEINHQQPINLAWQRKITVKKELQPYINTKEHISRKVSQKISNILQKQKIQNLKDIKPKILEKPQILKNLQKFQQKINQPIQKTYQLEPVAYQDLKTQQKQSPTDQQLNNSSVLFIDEDELEQQSKKYVKQNEIDELSSVLKHKYVSDLKINDVVDITEKFITVITDQPKNNFKESYVDDDIYTDNLISINLNSLHSPFQLSTRQFQQGEWFDDQGILFALESLSNNVYIADPLLFSNASLLSKEAEQCYILNQKIIFVARCFNSHWIGIYHQQGDDSINYFDGLNYGLDQLGIEQFYLFLQKSRRLQQAPKYKMVMQNNILQKQLDIKTNKIKITLQTNGSDCGPSLVLGFKKLINNQKLVWNLEEINLLRQELATKCTQLKQN